MHFFGEQADNLEKTVLDVLAGVIETGFAAPEMAARFKRVGGIPVTRNPEIGLQWFKSDQRPFIFIQLDGDDLNAWQKVIAGELKDGTRHELTFGIEAICPKATADFERPLKDCLRRVLERAYVALRTAGLEGSKVRVLKPEEHPDRRNPTQITATAYTM